MTTESDIIQQQTEKILSQLTLKEKLSLLTGADVCHTVAYEDVGLPAITMSDGPNGVRAQNAVSLCFPSACALASSFSREAVSRVGEMLGEEAAHNGISMLLGPAINIKRSPLCGRNFEYYSEDPYLTGELAFAYITGLQKYCGSCVKHFAVNNRENMRMSVDAKVSKRALSDIYLRAFRKALAARPVAVMSSYNKINGEYACENEMLLRATLRDDWKYDGMVVSDWGAVNDICASVKAGMTLEMPSNCANTQQLENALLNGAITEAEIDNAAQYVIAAALRTRQYGQVKSVDYTAHLSDCAAVGEECCVLLKNEDGILPIADAKTKIAVFGRGATEPRIQGGGSANVSPCIVMRPVDSLRMRFENVNLCESEDTQTIAAFADDSDVCIVFAGLNDEDESEGYDRESISFPERQTALIRTVCKANPNTVVILTQGGVTELPFKSMPKAILLTYLLGSAYGETLARVISGEGEPSGRLPESWIARNSDASAYPFYGNGRNIDEYGEGVFVGYRMYLSMHRSVNYPFGYGLGYTSFSHKDFAAYNEKNGIRVSVTVTNTGKRAGRTVVQVYAKVLDNDAPHPEAELVGFTKPYLRARESVRTELFIPYEDLKRYDYRTDGVCLYPAYEISVRENAEKVVAKQELRVSERKEEYDRNTCVGKILRDHPELTEELKPYLCLAILGNFNAPLEIRDGEAVGNEMFTHVMNDMPLRALYNLTGGKFSLTNVQNILERRDNGF